MNQIQSDFPTIIYKYVNYNDGIKLLFNRQLKFSTPDLFNDPYDCNENIFKFTINEKTTRFMLQKGLYQRDTDEINLSIKKLSEKLKNENKISFRNSEFKKMFDEIKRTIWVTCFSVCPNDFLMWSHYAESHKGFCIGFDPNYFYLKYNQKIFKVTYDKFKQYDFFENSQKAIQKWVTMKGPIWKDEHEYRLFFPKTKSNFINENGLLHFNENLIKSVSIGCKNNCKDELFKKSLERLGYENVDFIKYKLMEDSFNIESDRIN